MKLEPIVPFEPVTTEEIPAEGDWIAQVKWDGVRVLTYFDGEEVRLFNRKLNERTAHYPELAEISRYTRAKSVILDGEIIALRNGKPSFYEVMKRDGIRNLSKVDQVQKRVPITYMVFDILYADGEWLVSLPLKERQERLQDLVIPQEDVQVVGNVDDGAALFEVMEEKGMEGIVLKDLSSAYAIGGKDARWMKKKCYRDVIAVVGGVTFRGNIVNSLLLGLFDASGRLVYIGHAGTGKLTQNDWRKLTEIVPIIQQPHMPFREKPSRFSHAVWVKPVLTVKVRYIEWEEGHTLRQPSIQAWVKVPPDQCKLETAEKENGSQ